MKSIIALIFLLCASSSLFALDYNIDTIPDTARDTQTNNLFLGVNIGLGGGSWFGEPKTLSLEFRTYYELEVGWRKNDFGFSSGIYVDEWTAFVSYDGNRNGKTFQPRYIGLPLKFYWHFFKDKFHLVGGSRTGVLISSKPRYERSYSTLDEYVQYFDEHFEIRKINQSFFLGIGTRANLWKDRLQLNIEPHFAYFTDPRNRKEGLTPTKNFNFGLQAGLRYNFK